MLTITKPMKKAGQEVCDYCMDAHIAHSMAGMGGASPLDYATIPERYRDIVKRYIEDEDFTSVEAIYIAMFRASADDEVV